MSYHTRQKVYLKVAVGGLILLGLSCLKDGEHTLVLPSSHAGSTDRTINNQGTITLPEPNIEIALWDHQAIDYDIVSVFINDKVVVNHQLLDGPKNKFVVHHTLQEVENVLILYAHNEGAHSPNTVAMSIKSGSVYEECYLEADLQTNGSLTLIVQ